MSPPFATDHPFTPCLPSNPFGDPNTCRVILMRGPCPHPREAHPPGEPLRLDVFGYRRRDAKGEQP